ncbi:MAG: hypothetical protein ABUS57_07010 [Pseudomonadota bacterium]
MRWRHAGTMMRDLQPKKSEKIEVRLDHETKLALQTKASSEGLSVSDAIRGLIVRYVGDPSSSSFRQRRTHIMALSSIAAALATVMAIGVAGVAHARDVTVGVASQYIASPEAGPMPDFGPVQTNVDLDYGKPMLLCVPKTQGASPRAIPDGQTCQFDAAGGYTMMLWAQPGYEKSVVVGLQRVNDGRADPHRMLGGAPIAPGESAGMWSSPPGERSALGVEVSVPNS